MAIASASKWIYAAFVVERRGAAGLDPVADVPYLNFTSGYSNFPAPACPGTGGTIDDCLAGVRGSRNQTEAAERLFHYDSGHMERHASNIGLGRMNGEMFTAELLGQFGGDLPFSYRDVLLAGGAFSSAETYATFLRRMLIGSSKPLRIAGLLGEYSVCTLPATCPSAVFSPTTEDWQYSLGHWVENDQESNRLGLSAYSSAGALGFYPWVNFQRTHYGVIARTDLGGQQGFESSKCGRLIRLAYLTHLPGQSAATVAAR